MLRFFYRISLVPVLEYSHNLVKLVFTLRRQKKVWPTARAPLSRVAIACAIYPRETANSKKLLCGTSWLTPYSDLLAWKRVSPDLVHSKINRATKVAWQPNTPLPWASGSTKTKLFGQLALLFKIPGLPFSLVRPNNSIYFPFSYYYGRVSGKWCCHNRSFSSSLTFR